jgi:hypothetical protein
LAADSRSGAVLCNVQGEDGLETWVLDVAEKSWTRLPLQRQPDVSGSRNRVLLYLPDVNLFVLENRTQREQQIWTFRYAEAPPEPPSVQKLTVAAEPGGATLRWEAPPGSRGNHYDVYRGRGETPWQVELKRIAENLPRTTFRDTGLQPGTVYCYQIRPVDDAGSHGTASFVVRTQPPVVVDPVVSVAGPQRVELEWRRPPGDDVVGYHVERAPVSVYSTDQVVRIKSRRRGTSDLAVGRIRHIGRFRRLTQRPLRQARFVDETADLASGPREVADAIGGDGPLRPEDFDAGGKPYRYAVHAYRVRAINGLGVESGPSPLAFTYPSAVEGVFAKEEGDRQTRLRWRPAREKSVAAYLVYRHEGRWNSDAVVRLTPRPITATEYLDAAAGQPTRRYEIVAVDALGQEGEPSRPVCTPYVGSWHQ